MVNASGFAITVVIQVIALGIALFKLKEDWADAQGGGF